MSPALFFNLLDMIIFSELPLRSCFLILPGGSWPVSCPLCSSDGPTDSEEPELPCSLCEAFCYSDHQESLQNKPDSLGFHIEKSSRCPSDRLWFWDPVGKVAISRYDKNDFELTECPQCLAPLACRHLPLGR